MSSHIKVSLKALGALDAVANCTLSLHSEPITSPTVKSSMPLESSSSLQFLWSEAVSSSSKCCSISSSNRLFLYANITGTDCCFKWKQNAKSAMKKQSVDIWMWCHTPFQSYRPQLCDDSNNIRFMFYFLVRETYKAVCAIRDCKKKTQISRGEKKNEEIISKNCLPHHKRASSFTNTHKAAQLHFLPMLSRYSRMSESVQHDKDCSSLHDRWCFRCDEQCSSLHAEELSQLSFNFLPLEANVFCNCVMLIHKFWGMDQKGNYRCCWSWMKTNMTFFLLKVRGLPIEENWPAPDSMVTNP